MVNYMDHNISEGSLATQAFGLQHLNQVVAADCEAYAEVLVRYAVHGACHPSVKCGCNVVHEMDGISAVPAETDEGTGVGIDAAVGVGVDVVDNATDVAAGAVFDVEEVIEM